MTIHVTRRACESLEEIDDAHYQAREAPPPAARRDRGVGRMWPHLFREAKP